ncbi:hypothetical protein GCM10025768_21890 [Microbacterium pseudoresistens]|uniref:Sugar/nucleoside kinase (Ribokinase family) n=1 Tax=Microbacterium pseudoresistens TaxID=640634 RepID=A0A7Y9JLM4_9MICO|nr:hypothetical protein [Microbacterium pseudoresistens]NYD53485.1 sugar/nucleoside kinase (ribokinase family) [Microbacterium pseudoresistens]
MCAQADEGGRVVVIGEARIIEVRDRRGMRETVGGAGAAIAVRLARAGLSVSLAAAMPAGRGGEHIRRYLEDHRVTIMPVASAAATGATRVIEIGVDGVAHVIGRDRAEAGSAALDAIVSTAIADGLADLAHEGGRMHPLVRRPDPWGAPEELRRLGT